MVKKASKILTIFVERDAVLVVQALDRDYHEEVVEKRFAVHLIEKGGVDDDVIRNARTATFSEGRKPF